MNPAEFAIRNRLLSVLCIVLVLLGGALAYENMARFEDPEFIIREAVVVTPYPGATPQEVAEEVTETLETAIQEMGEVKEIRSESIDSMSRITVEIKYAQSPSREALQLIWTKLRNRVRDAQSQLPPGALEPIVNDDFGDVYGIYYLLTGDGYTPRELYEYAKELRTDLLSVDDVAKVAIDGHQSEAIYLEISRERAAALGISVEQVFADLAQQNAVVPGGAVRIGDRRVLIQPNGSIESVEALKNTVVSTPAAETVVYLSDVANIRRDYRDPAEFLNRYNGKPAIAIGVSNIPGANVVAMGDEIDAIIAEAKENQPIGMELNQFYHQGQITDAAVVDFAFNVFLALAIVLITLFLFMGLRPALIIGGVLVLTISATLATMHLLNIPMHRISLGALIIALGMLVDNAIVVAEGIIVGLQRGAKKLDVAKDIVRRSWWPLLGGTLVGILAFAPIGFAAGETAEYTNHLFWVVLISLLFSWVFAIILVPLLADILLKELSDADQKEPTQNLFMQRYMQFLRSALNRRWTVMGSVATLFILSLIGSNFIKDGFFPTSTTPQIAVDFWQPQGTDFAVTKDKMLKLEQALSELEGVEGVNTLIGAGALRYMLVYPPEAPNAAYGQILLRLDDYRKIEGLIPQIQQYISGNFPTAQAKVWRFQLGPGAGSKIEAEFAGPDPVVLRRLASEAQRVFAEDERLVAIKSDWRQPVSVVQPQYSEARGRRIGVSRQDFSMALHGHFSGREVGVFREGDTLIPIIARAPKAERQSIDSLSSLQIPSSRSGRSVSLFDVTDDVKTVWRDSILRRLDRVWTIKAQADPATGELPAEALERVRPAVENIELPPGYSLTWRGEYGESLEANESLASTLPAGLLAMVLVVVVLFNAIRQPLIIWLIVPLALIGVVLGLLVTNSAMEFMAILGTLSLSGLLIKNAIVLVDQMDIEIGEGKPRFDAVIDSAASRVRPVAMGSLTTIFGVIPLFFDAFFQSMAVVLVFGLVVATLLTLVVVPVLYAIFFKIDPAEVAATKPASAAGAEA